MNGLKASRLLSLGVLSLLLLSGCGGTPQKKDVFWPLPPEEPRIQWVEHIRGAEDVQKPGFFKRVFRYFTGSSRKANLIKPYAVHMDSRGRLLVTDSAWAALLVFDKKNGKFSLFGIEGAGVLSKPMGVSSDSRGRIYVTDTVQNRAVVFDPDGNFLLAMGKRGRFEQPVGIAVNDAKRRVYIVDTRKHIVSVFDSETGEFLFDFGGRGGEDGKMNWPTNIAIGPDGNVYLMDTFNFRVQIFDADGKFIRKFGGIGTGLGLFSKPKGIAVDSEGHIYVVDAAFNNVQIFNDEGQLLMFFGKIGSKPGEFWLPAGLGIDQEDRIYVADQYNHRISVFRFLSEKYKATPEYQASPVAKAVRASMNKGVGEEGKSE